MARQRDHRDVTPRENPYGQLPDDEDYETEYDPDEPDDGYDDGYDDEPVTARARVKKRGSSGGFFGSMLGRVLIIVIALLLVLIAVLVALRFIRGGEKPEDPQLPAQQGESLPGAAQPTDAPASIVFGPASTQEPTPVPAATDEPEATLTAEPAPTESPEPTATPLPIILTNTPTPSPTARPTNTPTPSPTPSPTPTPTATPRADLGTGRTNRDANLRESAAANAKVKKTVKKGLTVTIHESILDTKGNIWYNVTVDDLAVDGWMRDYVVTADQKLPIPTATPKAEAGASEKAGATPTPSLGEGVVGTGKTKKDANLRQIMNGKVIATLSKGKRVLIYGVSADKNGNVWYEVRAENGKKRGFMRDYLVTLDEGVTLELPEGAKQAKVTPTPKATPRAAAKERSDTEEIMTPKPATIVTPKPATIATPKPATISSSAGKTSTASAKATPTPKTGLSLPDEETDGDEEIAEEESSSGSSASASDSLMDREVIGRAVTNREANVRVKPASGAKLVRQLSKRVELMILAKYEDDKGALWYEVTTESGKTHGFVRDYVLDVTSLDRGADTLVYGDEG